jgi:hypothetical protein
MLNKPTYNAAYPSCPYTLQNKKSIPKKIIHHGAACFRQFLTNMLIEAQIKEAASEETASGLIT